jgi:hypothetical protein
MKHESVLNNNKYIVLFYYTNWCTECKKVRQKKFILGKQYTGISSEEVNNKIP